MARPGPGRPHRVLYVALFEWSYGLFIVKFFVHAIMTVMSEIDSDQIAENANAPKSVTVDGQTVTQHSLPDQIAAEKYRRKAGSLDSGNPMNKLLRVRTIARGAND